MLAIQRIATQKVQAASLSELWWTSNLTLLLQQRGMIQGRHGRTYKFDIGLGAGHTYLTWALDQSTTTNHTEPPRCPSKRVTGQALAFDSFARWGIHRPLQR